MSEQKRIEDVINETLTGDTQKNALDFAAFLQANDFSSKWNNEYGGWNIAYKDKSIVFVTIIGETNELVVALFGCDYDDYGTVDDGLREFIWAHVVICPDGCGAPTICEMSQKSVVILGKAYENICVSPVKCFNFDAHNLEMIQKWMLMLTE